MLRSSEGEAFKHPDNSNRVENHDTGKKPMFHVFSVKGTLSSQNDQITSSPYMSAIDYCRRVNYEMAQTWGTANSSLGDQFPSIQELGNTSIEDLNKMKQEKDMLSSYRQAYHVFNKNAQMIEKHVKASNQAKDNLDAINEELRTVSSIAVNVDPNIAKYQSIINEASTQIHHLILENAKLAEENSELTRIYGNFAIQTSQKLDDIDSRIQQLQDQIKTQEDKDSFSSFSALLNDEEISTKQLMIEVGKISQEQANQSLIKKAVNVAMNDSIYENITSQDGIFRHKYPRDYQSESESKYEFPTQSNKEALLQESKIIWELAEEFIDTAINGKKYEGGTITHNQYKNILDTINILKVNNVITPEIKKKASIAAYNASDRGKASRAAYNASDKGKASRAAYNASDKGKAARTAYEASDRRKAARIAYNASDKGKAARTAYNASDKGKAARTAYEAKKTDAEILNIQGVNIFDEEKLND